MAERPVSYERACQSLWDQTFEDWEHIVLWDNEGHGIVKANAMFADPDLKVNGKFVALLDDDDEFAHPSALTFLASGLRNFSSWLDEPYPQLAIVRCWYAQKGGVVLPADEDWTYKPMKAGSIGGQCVVARRDIWERCRGAWAKPSSTSDWGHSSDFSYAVACWETAKTVLWHDEVLIRQQRTGLGRTDKDLGIK